MTECEHIEACRMAYGGEGCKPACDLGLPCHLYKSKIDRDALLELADEMERIADENRMTGMMGIGRARSWAERIREALGVADA